MSFERIWQQAKEFDFSTEEQSSLCPFAEKFSEWVRELGTKVTRDSSIVTVNQAKIMLIDKYFEWRAVVPKAHRNRIGVSGHHCIFHVFVQTYELLKAVELSLTPPMLFLPPSPLPPAPPPSPPQIAGIFIGEIGDE